MNRHFLDYEKEWMEDVRSDYEVLLRVVDFIAGMTDRYAIQLYRSLQGLGV